ncbi:hypothetical protein CFC21_075658 [Triticum aestivum]|uniref:Peptidase M48 domain-containing protein n=3 Tax=Triticinae TaxID=1648030 RepID=A0A9R1KXP2_WHEAT|nr:mitochondrial metalloendopeptidase OMA1-like [Triticum aestivum]KAF7070105.1 hypothetical protein CFC21_075658 [Triticum aestivum]
MNRLWCSLSQMLRRSAAPQRLLHWCSSSAPRVTPSTVLPRRFRWYHDPRKATAATAIGLGAAALAACEVVPCTNRCHLVVYSRQGERDLGESLFAAELKSIHRHRMVDPHHPDSIRVRLIAERIIHAAKRGLGIYDSRDAPLLRVTRKGKKPWAPQPHTRHLHGLNGSWELVLARHTSANAMSAPGGKLLVFTGLLDYFKTDGEIAFALAHEVGHLIARHQADIGDSVWLPDFLRRIFLQRMEIEADRIGILLLAAAGFHPNHALAVAKKQATIAGGYSVWKQILDTTHPHPKDRLARLSEAKTMEEALELYNEANAMDKVTEKYFSGNPSMSISDENGISKSEK